MKKGQFSSWFLFVLYFLYEIKRSIELQPCCFHARPGSDEPSTFDIKCDWLMHVRDNTTVVQSINP